MMYPYAEFLLSFARKHQSFRHQNRASNTKAALIVETRPHYFLPAVLKNTMFFLGPEWNLYVLCGEMNDRFVRQSVEGWAVQVSRLEGVYHLPVSDYNRLLTARQLWDRFAEDQVLVFQVDTLLCGARIGGFLEYDFVGAPCGSFDEQYVANGGLSLRATRRVLECLERVPYREAVPEDVYFTHAMRAIGAAMPDYAKACRFAVESIFFEHPVGVHGTDKCFHTVEQAERIVAAIEY